ncbi:MAG: gamma-glutamylcyclotransferase [Gammaproteobacteria bacterium]
MTPAAGDPLLYLAYGSNLHPLRLGERVPSARLLGAVALAGWSLRFHKRSDVDGSAKCDLMRTGAESDLAYGALYRMAAGDKPALDAAEGAGYRQQILEVDLDGVPRRAFAYLAETSYRDDSLAPYDWYRNLVVAGARFLGLPCPYVSAIEGVAAISDPDEVRRQHALTILENMRRSSHNSS